jgi:hypothetical protein
MTWSEVQEFFTLFRTDNIMQQLQDWNVGDLSTNPWFLGAFVILILFTYFMGWGKISAFMVGIGGFTLMLSLAIGKGTGTEGIASGGLWIVVGGGAVIVAMFIYLLFVKAD